MKTITMADGYLQMPSLCASDREFPSQFIYLMAILFIDVAFQAQVRLIFTSTKVAI